MLEILHHDDHLVAIHKPAGLLVHRSVLDRHETRFAIQLLRDQIGRRVIPVHRLDKGTSGVLVFAFEKSVAATLACQFESRAVDKTYLAVVRGWPEEQGTIDHPLAVVRDDYEAQRVEPAPDQAAITRFARLATVELGIAVDRYPSSRYALLELSPETGRRHQIRRHLKHASHPVIGDATYGKGRHNRMFQAQFGITRLLLACVAMRLTHPDNGQPLDLVAPPAADFQAALTALGWRETLAGKRYDFRAAAPESAPGLP